jgi:hypothetical protein
MFNRSQQSNRTAVDPGGIRTRCLRTENPPLDEPFSAIHRRNEAVDRCVWAALTAKLRHGRMLAWQGLASVMPYATSSRVRFTATSPSPFNALLHDKRRSSAQGAPS